MSTNLGEGLEKLIEQVGSPLARAQDIATIPVNDPRRRTYRLWFKDGRELKGRYYLSSRFAQVARRIRNMNELEFLPIMVAQEGDAMLEEWITGRTLGEGKVDGSLIRECGRMQGRLHRCVMPSLADLDFRPMQVPDWAEMMKKSLANLVDGKVLPEAEARRLEELAIENMPENQTMGIVNRDLCPENIVQDMRGRLFLVDNGSLTAGLIEEDLCRTWYRWPMKAAEREAFSSGYREFGDPAAFENPSVFWRIVVVANSASFRLKASPAAALAVLDRLEGLLQTSVKS